MTTLSATISNSALFTAHALQTAGSLIEEAMPHIECFADRCESAWNRQMNAARWLVGCIFALAEVITAPAPEPQESPTPTLGSDQPVDLDPDFDILPSDAGAIAAFTITHDEPALRRRQTRDQRRAKSLLTRQPLSAYDQAVADMNTDPAILSLMHLWAG